MNPRKALVTAGIAVFALGLVLNFPVRVAYHWFAPDTLQLNGLSGSLWRGSAAEGLVGNVYLRNIAWRFRPLALLGGKIGVDASADPPSGFLEARVAVSPTGTVTFRDVNGTLALQAFED